MSNKGITVFNGILSRNSKETVALIKKEVEEGNVDLAYLGVALKKLHKIAETVKEDKEIQYQIEEALKTYQEGTKKTFSLHGAKITIANTGYWDYSQTEDPMLEAMESIALQMKEQIKLRKEELQNKAIALEKRNTPTDGGMSFGVSSFNIDVETIPKLVWEEAIAQISTNPPIKKGKESLRFSL